MAQVIFMRNLVHRRLRSASALLAGLLVAALSGCSLLDCCSTAPPAEPPPVPVNHVLTYWEPSIRVATDTQNNGAPMPGLAGRVFLINDDMKHCVEAQGKIVARLYDVTPVAAGGAPKLIAGWEIDQITLRKLRRKDLIGDGYTLFLPWETYRPDIGQIKLQVAYVPRDGTPHYGEDTTITLRPESRMAIEQTQKVVTATGLAPVQR